MIPSYPGHGAPKCNGCGLCCQTTPCALSAQANLWTSVGCSAHVWSEKKQRHVCDAIDHPERYRIAINRKQRLEMTGDPGKGCTFRAAWSDEDAQRLLDKPNAMTPTGFPRTVWLFKADGPHRLRRES